MTAGDIDLDSIAYSSRSIRDSGVIVMVEIVYANWLPWSGLVRGKPQYTYEVSILDKDSYKVESVHYGAGIHAIYDRTYINRHGIKLVFIQSGSIARFNFQSFLIVIATSLSLIAIATSVVDNCMMYILPLRVLYIASKYEETRDFSDLLHENRMNKRRSKDFDPAVYTNLTHPLSPAYSISPAQSKKILE